MSSILKQPQAAAVRSVLFALVAAVFAAFAGAASAQGSAGNLRQAIAQAAAGNSSLAAFYKARDYEPIWVGNSRDNKRRVDAFIDALNEARDHALPVASYRGGELAKAIGSSRSAVELAKTEVAFSTSFLAYANDIQSGILDPARVDSEIKRSAPRRDGGKNLEAFSKSSPAAFIQALPPQTREYEMLLAERASLEQAISRGGWGAKVPGSGLKAGQSGGAVTALAGRLSAMGYMSGTRSSYDSAVQQAVARFQKDHGLAPDGVAGKGTLAEVNKDPEDRLKQVATAMERERWSNLPQGRRHVLVNIPDFTARIMDNGRTAFETRAVVGSNQSTHRTPEFSDVMEFVVVNPTWNVPASITAREYLPMLQQDPNAVSHLQLVDDGGNVVLRASVDFAAYDGSNFPYRLKEPPSEGNALGQVKFMFPNRYNIYLHDTPAKSLFSRETRAYSHGCIRLNDPLDFANALLKPETGNPAGLMQSRLDTGRESVVELKQPLRVHLRYRTAFQLDADDFQYRRDVYGRDAKVFAALARAGVSLGVAGG